MKQLVRAVPFVFAFFLSTNATATPFAELLTAIAAGAHMDVLNALETKDMDVHEIIKTRREYGWTAVHWAVKHKRHEMLQLLVEAEGIAVDTRDSKDTGWTPLHLAAALGHRAEARELLRLGANAWLEGEVREKAIRSGAVLRTKQLNARQMALHFGHEEAAAFLEKAMAGKG